jgi:hypothetical protein
VSILERISPRFDVWEEPEAPSAQVEQIGEAVQRSIDLAWLVASPLVLLVDWLRRSQQAVPSIPAWQSIGSVGPWQVWSQTWMDSDDFPPGLDLYGPPEDVYALMRLRFEPVIPHWEQRYFFEEHFPAKDGLYLLSYNPPGEGMTLHWLPADGSEPTDIVRLAPHQWEIEGAAGEAILLEAISEVGLERVMVAPRW